MSGGKDRHHDFHLQGLRATRPFRRYLISYPAYEAFAKDRRVGWARWRVYMALQPPVLAFDIPVDLKTEVGRRLARTSTRATVDALAWLEEAGYIKVHSRDARGTRRVTLAYRLSDADVSAGQIVSPAAPTRNSA